MLLNKIETGEKLITTSSLNRLNKNMLNKTIFKRKILTVLETILLS
jgi:hypothetical protein